MANKRLYFAIYQAGLAENATTNYQPIHGLQTCSIDTTFNLEQVFEIGQLNIYENIENIPDITVTLEKVIDGYPLIYTLASSGAPSNTLGGRSNERSMFVMSVFDDTKDAASGNAISTCLCSGMYVSALNYTFPTEGNCTEQVTLVGNQKQWLASGFWAGQFDNNDAPAAAQGVQRRENVVMASSLWPTDIPGINGSNVNVSTSDGYSAHLQTATVSVNLGREALFELGRRGPYFRYVTFPVEVTCSIEVTTASGDTVTALEDPSSGTNLANQPIKIVLNDGLNTTFDLGTKNKLSSVTFGGGDATGGNATATYNYSNFNFLTVTP